MKNLRKQMSVLLVMALVFIAVGCGVKPEKAVETTVNNFFGDVKKGELSNLDKYYKDYQKDEVADETSENKEIEQSMEDLLKKVNEKLSYKIKETKVDGDTATVTLDVSYVDMSEDIMTALQSAVVASLGSEDSDSEKAVVDAIKGLEVSDKMKDAEITLKLEKVEKEWKISNNDDATFQSAVTGNLVNMFQ